MNILAALCDSCNEEVRYGYNKSRASPVLCSVVEWDMY